MKKRHSPRQQAASAHLLPDRERGSEDSSHKDSHCLPCGGPEVREEAVLGTETSVTSTPNCKGEWEQRAHMWGWLRGPQDYNLSPNIQEPEAAGL